MGERGRLNRWLTAVRQRVSPVVPPGTYPYLRQSDGQQTRFHLRVDEDGGGVLLANATMAARLSLTGTAIAKRLLDGGASEEIARDVQHAFRGATRESVQADVRTVQQLIETLSAPGDNYPILNFAETAFGATPHLEKPLSAELPLADPAEIVPLLDRLWRIGIPHVIFQALPGSDPQWAARAVERAEDLGMIAGVRGAAGTFDSALLKDLALAGVDHINLYFLSADSSAHDAMFGAGDHASGARAYTELLSLEVCPVAEIPLLEQTAATVDATVESLLPLGVANFGFFALIATADTPAEAREDALTPDAVLQAATLIEESSADWNARSLWYPPVRRDAKWSLAEQVRRGPASSGDHSIRVAPDGQVFAPRGAWEPVGNVLHEDWSTIHGRLKPRRREPSAKASCDVCPGLAICPTDCPRSTADVVESWPEDTLRRKAARP